MRKVTKVCERSRIQKNGEDEPVRNAVFVAGAIDFRGHIAIKAVRVGGAAVDVSAVRRDAAQSPMKPRGADFVQAKRSESRDLPVMTQVAFELRLKPRKAGTDRVGCLECFG